MEAGWLGALEDFAFDRGGSRNGKADTTAACAFPWLSIGLEAKNIKRPLGTGDYSKAVRLVKTVALEIESEFDMRRRKIGHPSAFVKCANSGDSPVKRRLVGLSEIERRDFILRAFITGETQESVLRIYEPDKDAREQKLEVPREDLAENALKRYPGLSLVAAAERESKLP